jgi:hypothetical protein
MKKTSLSRNNDFRAMVFFVLVAIALVVITYLRVYPVDAYVGPFQVFHWASVIGAAIAALFAPIYVVLKRRCPQMRRVLFTSHMYVNLIAFEFISMHFGVVGQVKPGVDTGTGFLQYVVVALLIFTGIMRRFQLMPRAGRLWPFLHVSLVLSFYLVLVDHVIGAAGLL